MAVVVVAIALAVVEGHDLGISPEVFGVIVMRARLAQVAEEMIEALLAGMPGGEHRVLHILHHTAQSPFTNDGGGVSRALQQFRHGFRALRKRGLAVGEPRTVGADVGMARMQAGHQRTAGRGADRVAGIMRRKLHAFGRQRIQLGGLNQLLTIVSNFPIPKVIGEDVDHVGLRGLGCNRRACKKTK
jgi:hypothetical protein